ncbi:MAG: hypothetical protein V4439_02705 [Patescibacteria group bacterium]
MHNKIYTRLIPFMSICMATALLWDAWWHVAIGRDQFFIPPHTALYLCLSVIIICSFIAWRKTKNKIYRNSFWISLLFPITGVLDQAWHSVFGTENLISPIVVWSPPHLLILGSLITLTLFSRKIAKLGSDHTVDWLLDCGLWATFLGYILIFTLPFFPLGAYRVMGFWGAGIVVFTWIAVMLHLGKQKKKSESILLTTIFYAFISSVGPATLIHPAPGVIINEFFNPPFWLFLFSYILPAIIVETIPKFNLVIKGLIMGILSAVIFYVGASYLVHPNFAFTTNEIIISVLSCAVAGVLAGVFILKIKGK